MTPSSHTWIDGDPSSFLPDPFLVLPDGSNSTCFSHCPNLPVIYPLFCHGQVLTPLTSHPEAALARSVVPNPSSSCIFPPSSPTPKNLSFTLEVMTATTPRATFSFGDSCKKRWEWSTSHRAAHPLLNRGQGHSSGRGGTSIQIQMDAPSAFPPFPREF